MEEQCLFCRIVAGEVDATIVFEDDHCLAFEDINPTAPTHVLVIPRQHIATVNELGDGDEGSVGHLVTVAQRIAAERGHDGDGYRLVINCNRAGGQTVYHLHLHLLGGRTLSWPPG